MSTPTIVFVLIPPVHTDKKGQTEYTSTHTSHFVPLPHTCTHTLPHAHACTLPHAHTSPCAHTTIPLFSSLCTCIETVPWPLIAPSEPHRTFVVIEPHSSHFTITAAP